LHDVGSVSPTSENQSSQRERFRYVGCDQVGERFAIAFPSFRDEYGGTDGHR
jgi:hypothetical protein